MIKFEVNLKHCWIGTTNGVIVDIDSLITVVVCGKMCGEFCGKCCAKMCG